MKKMFLMLLPKHYKDDTVRSNIRRLPHDQYKTKTRRKSNWITMTATSTKRKQKTGKHTKQDKQNRTKAIA